ncbi:MAG: hypothetical protein ACRC8C_02660 [Mycoplasmoidaceae bacterium]
MNNTIIIGNGIFYKYGHYDFKCEECIREEKTDRCFKCKEINYNLMFKKEINKIIDLYFLKFKEIDKLPYDSSEDSIFTCYVDNGKESKKSSYYSLGDRTHIWQHRILKFLNNSNEIDINIYFPGLVYLKIKELRKEIDNKFEEVYFEDLIENIFYNDIYSIEKNIENPSESFLKKHRIELYKKKENKIIFSKELSIEEIESDDKDIIEISLDEVFKNKINQYSLCLYSCFVDCAVYNLTNDFSSKRNENFSNSLVHLKIKNWYTFNYFFDKAMVEDFKISPLKTITYLHGQNYSNSLGFIKEGYEKHTGSMDWDNINERYEKLNEDFLSKDDIFLFGISPKGEEKLIHCINNLKIEKNIFISYKCESDKKKWKELIEKNHKLFFWFIDEWENKSKEYYQKIKYKKFNEA